MPKRAATGVGFIAVLSWALLAALSQATGSIPPLQLTAITFLIGGLLGVATWPFRPRAVAQLRQSPWVWVLGVGGLFAYHALYFAAIKNAPAVDVSLIAYLWPMLIVVFAGFLPGEGLRVHHLLGTGLGLLGAFFVISRGQLDFLHHGLALGHVLALPLPFIWAGYSLLASRTAKVPTDVVVGFCIATGVLAWGLHLAVETTVWPDVGSEWVATVTLGLLPLGIGFYAWDYGLKHGDVFVVGASSFATPLLSTLILVGLGQVDFHWSILVACLLITGGAILAAKDLIFGAS